MGGRYCAINSPLGSRWGQKSLDLRSRDFCPHLEPRGELIAQYRPPMSFRYNIHRTMLSHYYTVNIFQNTTLISVAIPDVVYNIAQALVFSVNTTSISLPPEVYTSPKRQPIQGLYSLGDTKSNISGKVSKPRDLMSTPQ